MNDATHGATRPSAPDRLLSADADDLAEQQTPLDPDELDDREPPHTGDDRPEADVIEQWTDVPDDGYDDYR